MNTDLLIAHGNTAREQHKPEEAIKYYAQAFVQDPECAAAFNNYGNVVREMGYPERAIPFLEHARILDPNNVTAEFNLSVAHLLKGDYEKGWPLYESRWRYEHLADAKPKLSKPEWINQDVNGKTIFIIGEQGLGDQIQFVRFIWEFIKLGAIVKLHVSPSIQPLFSETPDVVAKCVSGDQDPGEYDYWVAMMSIPARLNITLETLPSHLQYIKPSQAQFEAWQQLLGPKTKMRIGIAWSGRKDSWINQHKSIPVEALAELVKRHPEHQWVSLQVDATPEEDEVIKAAGVQTFPGTISTFADSGSLIANMDLVISVDTAVAHMSAAMGRPTWIPLNSFGTCWRWLTKTDSSPWYPSVRLFRQTKYGDWSDVIYKIEKFLGFFKV